MCFFLQKSPPKKSGAPKSILFLGPRAFCSWAYQGISYPVRGTSAAVKFKGSKGGPWGPVEGVPAWGIRAPIKMSVKLKMSIRGGNPSPKGARNRGEVVDDPPRLAPTSQQNKRRPKWIWFSMRGNHFEFCAGREPAGTGREISGPIPVQIFLRTVKTSAI